MKTTTKRRKYRQPDSPEQIAVCLNCTKPDCRGHCQLNKAAKGATKKRGQRPRMLDEAGENRVALLRERGYKWREIVEVMKISKNTAQRAYQRVKEREENT